MKYLQLYEGYSDQGRELSTSLRELLAQEKQLKKKIADQRQALYDYKQHILHYLTQLLDSQGQVEPKYADKNPTWIAGRRDIALMLPQAYTRKGDATYDHILRGGDGRLWLGNRTGDAVSCDQGLFPTELYDLYDLFQTAYPGFDEGTEMGFFNKETN